MDDKNTQLILNTLNEHKAIIEARFDKIEAKLDSHDEKFDHIEARLDSYDKKFDRIEERLTSLENTVTFIEFDHGKKIDMLLEHVVILEEINKSIQEAIDKINSKLDNHEIRIEILEEKVL